MNITPNIILSCFIILAICCSIHSQNNTVASGGDVTGAGGTVSYSIGQIDYINSTSGSGTITQGVQQPYEIYSMGIAELGINIAASVYPNPSANFILLSLSTDNFSNMAYALYNIEGKLLVQQIIMSKQTSISLFEHATGTYILKVLINNQETKIFKIIKNQ